MNFETLVEEVKRVPCQEMRRQESHYLEVVFSVAGLQTLAPVLESYFGPPMKPAGKAPSGDAKRYSEPYGGIRKEQTMYFHQEAGQAAAAMLWPWNCGTTVTLKMFRK